MLSKNELDELYINQNLSIIEIGLLKKVAYQTVYKWLKKHQLMKPLELKKIKRKQTCLEKYGYYEPLLNPTIQNKFQQTCLKKIDVSFPTQSKEIVEKCFQTRIKNSNSLEESYKKQFDVFQQTCLKRFGVSNPMSSIKVKEKQQETCLKNFGVDNPMKSEEISNKFKDRYFILKAKSKEYITKKKNKTSESSSVEDLIFNLLKQRFPKVIHHYSSNNYPFNCDFYIPEIDLYIEYQGDPSHHTHPFNENNIEDQLLVSKWLKKSEEFNFGGLKKTRYLRMIKTWTKTDVLKRQIAKSNGLNWLEFFTLQEFNNWFENQ